MKDKSEQDNVKKESMICISDATLRLNYADCRAVTDVLPYIHTDPCPMMLEGAYSLWGFSVYLQARRGLYSFMDKPLRH